MAHGSLLDIESDQPDDRSSSAERKSAVMDELITTVAVINGKLDVLLSLQHTYATKEELAVLNGKVDVLLSLQHTYATKAELADAVYQLTWRMAGFAVASVGAMAALTRYF